MLGDRDSNPDPTVQSRVPYHWTISQFACILSAQTGKQAANILTYIGMSRNLFNVASMG
jgi:hypothetical protein